MAAAAMQEKISDEMTLMVREVTNHNWHEELTLMADVISDCDYLAIDTEFPGFLRHTPREASDDQRYADLKSNVDATKLIQLGITFIDRKRGVPCGCWQFTLEDFDPARDAHAPGSIAFLRAHGLEFGRGVVGERIGSGCVRDILMALLSRKSSSGGIKWVTFHGLYDIAYLLKLVTGCPLPDTRLAFAEAAGRALGDVYDVKNMACRDPNLGGEMGLAGLARSLGVRLDGRRRHQGGYDSLVTAGVFAAMRCACGSRFDSVLAGSRGLLHGLTSVRIVRKLEMKHGDGSFWFGTCVRFMMIPGK